MAGLPKAVVKRLMTEQGGGLRVSGSALDAARLGFRVTVVLAACRAIDLGGSLATMTKKMQDAGVTLA